MVINTNEDFLRSLYNERLPKTYLDVSDVFESNYCKLLKLIGNLDSIQDNRMISQTGENDLYLILEEKAKYTGIYSLTHKLKSGNSYVNKPDIRFKVYFDAKLVEVISVCNENVMNRNHPFLAQCSDMDIQWEINIFLQSWLEYCLIKYKKFNWKKC